MTYRLHLKNKRRFVLLLSVLGFVLILLASILQAGAHTRTIPEPDFIVVQSGDTLWAIAEQHHQTGDIRSYIAEVRQLNHMDGHTIYAGQGLLLPVR